MAYFLTSLFASILFPDYLFSILKYKSDHVIPYLNPFTASAVLMIKICGGFQTWLQTKFSPLNLGGDCFNKQRGKNDLCDLKGHAGSVLLVEH